MPLPTQQAFGIQSGSIRAIVVDTQPAIEARYFDNTTQIYYIVRVSHGRKCGGLFHGLLGSSQAMRMALHW